MSRDDRTRRVEEYVRARLREEVANGPRGVQADIARRLGISAAHVSNMISSESSRRPGETVRRAAAEMWGMSLDELERAALGVGRTSVAKRPTRAEPSDDFPNRELAIAKGRAAGFESESPEAFARATDELREILFASGNDRDVAFWFSNLHASFERHRSSGSAHEPPGSPRKKKSPVR